MNIDILRCELVRVAVLYVQRSIYGFECDLDLLLARIQTLRNQIAILEEVTCRVNSTVYHGIRKDINKITSNTSINLCSTC